jgi:hypothetical protein
MQESINYIPPSFTLEILFLFIAIRVLVTDSGEVREGSVIISP